MFYGEKLRAVRELNGESRKQLATELGITEQAVWQFESEDQIPRIEILNQLREKMHVTPQFLFTPLNLKPVVDQTRVAYRAKNHESRKLARMETRYLDFADGLVNYFEKFLTTPDTPFAQIQRESIAMQTTPLDNGQINQVADFVRSRLQVKHDRDLMSILELAGIYITEKALGADIDAYSTQTADGRPWIVMSTEKKSAVRRNFDLAHELGHLVLHTHIDFDALNPADYIMVEKQAHQFAADFLLPEAEFRQDYALIGRHSNPDSYVALKQKYHVSIVAMGMRAYSLGLMSYQEYRYFFGRLNKLGYKNQEPLDDQLVPVRPGRIKALIALLFDHEVLTVDDLKQRLHILPAFVVKLFALDDDFFDRYTTKKPVFYTSDNVIPMHPQA